MNGEYGHLAAAARSVIEADAETRVRFARTDRWIGYTRAVMCVARMEELMDWPTSQRMDNLLVVGATNNGKSMIVEKFRRGHPTSHEDDRERTPVVVMQMPPVPTVSRFYVAILDALGVPFPPSIRALVLERLAVNCLRDAGVRMLVIDELHNMLAARSTERHNFLNLIRYLGNELRIPLVAVGTQDAYLAIQADPQLENRFEPFPLPKWSVDDDLLVLLASFESLLPLRRPSNLATKAMATHLLERTEGTIGELTRLLVGATVVAIGGEERITPATLSAARYASPSSRRKALLGA